MLLPSLKILSDPKRPRVYSRHSLDHERHSIADYRPYNSLHGRIKFPARSREKFSGMPRNIAFFGFARPWCEHNEQKFPADFPARRELERETRSRQTASRTTILS